ncbi:hypothetical protein F2P81_010935 [Scophthalmus maximus]|uniref:Uncharacterized protein n=1 Tax=Scophthalmus maximus TaxID=52904 RepID=A0A6A4SNR1_SCOMX|nr:hypothetical protein F2P81_010935 [Scophthalmus maximus]
MFESGGSERIFCPSLYFLCIDCNMPVAVSSQPVEEDDISAQLQKTIPHPRHTRPLRRTCASYGPRSSEQTSALETTFDLRTETRCQINGEKNHYKHKVCAPVIDQALGVKA